jgi:hypothetical protein
MVAEFELVAFPMKHPNSSVLMTQQMKVDQTMLVGSCCLPQGNVQVTLSSKRVAFFCNLIDTHCQMNRMNLNYM